MATAETLLPCQGLCHEKVKSFREATTDEQGRFQVALRRQEIDMAESVETGRPKATPLCDAAKECEWPWVMDRIPGTMLVVIEDNKMLSCGFGLQKKWMFNLILAI